MTEHNGNGNGEETAFRLVVTGGPGGGKTTAADLFRREIGDRVVLVPEAATMLFGGGFPRMSQPGALRATQRAIFHVQRNLEDVHSAQYPHKVLLCDRGTVDGAAYWPSHPEAFFSSLGTSLEKEFKRYDGVIFFETAAAGGLHINSNNPTRIETLAAAVELDRKLYAIWSKHSKFVFVPNDASFMKKITVGLRALQDMVQSLTNGTK